MHSPQGFYLSRDEGILHIARGGQVDDRPLFDQLPPCRNWLPSTPRCFTTVRQKYADAISKFNQLQLQLVSLWNGTQMGYRIPLFGESQWRISWATLVPKDPSHIEDFQTIAFTKTSEQPSGSDLERISCIIPDQNNNGIYQSLVLKDIGKIDGIERILFAYRPLQHWSTSLLLSDAIHHFLKNTVILNYGKKMI